MSPIYTHFGRRHDTATNQKRGKIRSNNYIGRFCIQLSKLWLHQQRKQCIRHIIICVVWNTCPRYIHSSTATSIPQSIESALKFGLMTILVGSVVNYWCCGGYTSYRCTEHHIMMLMFHFCLPIGVKLGVKAFPPFLLFLTHGLFVPFGHKKIKVLPFTTMKKMPDRVREKVNGGS